MDNTKPMGLSDKLAKYITRNDAAKLGLKRYFTGMPCKHGHDSERYTTTSGCVECLRRVVPKTPPDPYRLFHLPYRALNFDNCEGGVATREEAHAVFRWIEAAAWHKAALKILRADPELMARFNHEWTEEEKFATGRAGPDPTPKA